MTSKKPPSSKRAALPRTSDYTKTFIKDWERLTRSGRFDMNRLKQLRRRDTVPEQKEYERTAKLMAKYGLTHEDYLRLLKEQDGKCAICRTDNPRQRSEHFHIDHNHETGEIRGLLCSPCNQGLGYFQENVEVMAKAIAYLAGQPGQYRERG